MTINKLLFTCLFLTVTFSLKAQDAIPASGGDATGSGGSAAYSIGQALYTSSGSASGSVNQGVQQPYVFLTTDATIFPEIKLSVAIYPNPAITYITLNVGNQNFEKLFFQLFDAQGKLLSEQKITTVETLIKMEAYAPGNYFLKIQGGTSELKVFKIIKN